MQGQLSRCTDGTWWPTAAAPTPSTVQQHACHHQHCTSSPCIISTAQLPCPRHLQHCTALPLPRHHQHRTALPPHRHHHQHCTALPLTTIIISTAQPSPSLPSSLALHSPPPHHHHQHCTALPLTAIIISTTQPSPSPPSSSALHSPPPLTAIISTAQPSPSPPSSAPHSLGSC